MIEATPDAARLGLRSELIALFRLGAPMAATQMFVMAMGFLDTAMAGHYSSTDLAGVALGSHVLWPVMMFFAGLSMALTPIIAQMRGSNALALTGIKIRQGIWLALISSVICVVMLINASPIYTLVKADPAAAAVAEAAVDQAAGRPAEHEDRCRIATVFGGVLAGREQGGHRRRPGKQKQLLVEAVKQPAEGRHDQHKPVIAVEGLPPRAVGSGGGRCAWVDVQFGHGNARWLGAI